MLSQAVCLAPPVDRRKERFRTHTAKILRLSAELPVVVGGIIPEEDAQKLRAAGVQRVYTPKDFDLTRIMGEVVDVVSESRAAA